MDQDVQQTLLNHLMASYEHLESKRLRLRKEYEELDATLQGLRKEIVKLRGIQPQLFPSSAIPERSVYQNISIRWAILWLLSEAVGPMTTPNIADALRNGGVAERPNFNSIVSAILSQMAQKAEVERIDNAWLLTIPGRSVWDSIKRSDKFLNRHNVPIQEES